MVSLSSAVMICLTNEDSNSHDAMPLSPFVLSLVRDPWWQKLHCVSLPFIIKGK